MFGSNPFGQSSSSPFGSQPAFGQTTNVNAFGQSSSSPFGSQPAFGQTTNANNNPFTPKPFGSTSPFGSQTGGSIFGGMSTGVFGAQSSSPLGSTSVFGASSPAFGSSTSAFGVSSAPAFGNSSSAFGGSGVFGQKPSFGGFGSNTTQTSPFGNSFQQTQPAFGSNLFGSSTQFGAPSQPAFGSSSSPAFGASSTSGFGATSTPAFGSTASPTFGSTSGGFGVSTSPFGSSTPGFGTSSTPAFGSITTPAFGATTTPAFGATTTPAFGASSAPAFGASSAPAFGASTTPAFGASNSPFNFGSSPAFGQSNAVFGSTPFATSSLGVQNASFGAQTTASTFGGSGFGQSAFGGQRGGSRLAPYSSTPETDGVTGTQPAGKIESISAMPVYKDKSHEELRWEDYQLGDKGGPAPAGQSTTPLGFNTSSFTSASAPAFAQSSATPFSSTSPSNPFAQKNGAFGNSGFGSSPSSTFGSSPFATSNTSNPFGSTTSATPSLFGPSAQTFASGTSPSMFGNSNPSPFGSPQGTSSAFNTGLGFANTQSSPLFQSNMSTLQPASSPFAPTSSSFGQTAPGFSQTNLFSTPSTGFGSNMFSSTPLLSNTNPQGFGQTTPSLPSPFQMAQPPQSSGGFSFSTFGQSQAAGTNAFGVTPGIYSQNTFGQLSTPQSAVSAQPSPIVNPFGTLPAMPQISIGRTGTSPSIQYGISSLPIVEKPVPARISWLLTPRHLSQRRVRLPVRKYHPKIDGPKVPFFNDGDEETPSTPKADALFIPRENPRALVIRPLDQWPSRASGEKKTQFNATDTHAYENGKLQNGVSTLINGHKVGDKDASHAEHSVENGLVNDQVNPVKRNLKSNVVHDGRSTDKGDSYITLGSHRAGEAAIVFEHGADIEALMPKLRHSDYYTEPRIQELAAKERAEPGFCRNVKDFVVGRNGFGSIKFLGETDVRKLDLESLIQFNNREVIVYMDESKKPPIGQGLNKPAEVTLLNIKCFDKKTGQQYTDGPRIERYKEMLKRKAEDQGAEFVSYNPIKGEWKFRVNHFSMYEFGNDQDEKDDPPNTL